MIKLEVEDYCQDCPEFEPAYSHVRYLGTGKCDTYVECEHRIKCYGISDISERLSIAESTVKHFVDGGE